MDTQNEMKRRRTYGRRSGIVFGILLILLGGLLIGKNFGIVPNLNSIIISWQMLLIVIGIVSLSKRSYFTGFCLILVGGFFIIPKLAVVFPCSFAWVSSNFVCEYWSLLLITAGIFIIVHWLLAPCRWSKWEHKMFGHHHHCKHGEKQYEINGEFSKTHVFSAGEYIVLEPEFKGGDLKVTFGASEIDLRRTSLPEGDTYLEIKAVFSGIVLLVPDSWKIESRMECVFAGIADKRPVINNVDTSRRLILVGSCVFSGCEIKF